ncbi:hypothetical protein Ddc_15378 [Ditylenchus destructor]|nr:hypothetical protein Ddc_15378 [Ditylenchus destructor]
MKEFENENKPGGNAHELREWASQIFYYSRRTEPQDSRRTLKSSFMDWRGRAPEWKENKETCPMLSLLTDAFEESNFLIAHKRLYELSLFVQKVEPNSIPETFGCAEPGIWNLLSPGIRDLGQSPLPSAHVQPGSEDSAAVSLRNPGMPSGPKVIQFMPKKSYAQLEGYSQLENLELLVGHSNGT